MNIAQCSDSFLPIIDGVGTVVTSYANVLANRGNEVYVITPLDNTGFRGKYPFEIVDFTSFKLSRKLPWKLGLDSIDSHFAERVKLLNLDIVHVHSPGIAGMVGVKIAKKKGIPVVGSFHSKYYDDILKITHMKTLAKLGAKIIGDFYDRCDEVWAVSENAAKELKSYGCKKDIVIMPNGTQKRQLNESRIEETKTHFGIKGDVPVFLFVGQINWKKNIKRVIETCALLKNEGLDFQLVFAGRGPDEKEVSSMIQKCGLQNRTIMTGHLEDTEVLDCLYHLADLFLFPSVYDNAPMVLREAACMQTPSVVIEGSSAAEVVVNMKNSLTCKDDTQSMADVIKNYLALSPRKKAAIKKNAYETIPVDWEGPLMDNVLSRYQNLIDNNRRKNKRRKR